MRVLLLVINFERELEDNIGERLLEGRVEITLGGMGESTAGKH